MLTALEKQIQRATAKGNWLSFQKLFDQWKDIHGGSLPKEKLAEVFITSPNGSPIIALLDEDLPRLDDNSNDPKVKILKRILDECRILEDDIWTNRLENSSKHHPESATGMQPNRRITLSEWAANNQAGVLLEHDVIKRIILKEEMAQLFYDGKLVKVRQIYEKNKDLLNKSKVELFDDFLKGLELFKKTPGGESTIFNDPVEKDKLILKMMDNNEITIMGLPFQRGTVSDAIHTGLGNPRIKQRTLYKLAEALSKLSTDINEIPKINDLMQLYFVDEKDPKAIAFLATALLTFCCDVWKFPSPVAVANPELAKRLIKEKEKILLTLMKKGAEILSNPPSFMPAENLYIIRYMHFHNMIDAIKHDSFKTRFRKLDLRDQIGLIEACFQEGKAEIFEVLCSYVDNTQFGNGPIPPSFFDFKGRMRLDDFCRLVGEWAQPSLPLGMVIDPADKTRAENRMKMLGTLLKYDLVAGIELDGEVRYFVQPPHLAPMPNPKTNSNYTLEEFIKDVPVLEAGWFKPIRDAKLMQLYALTRETLTTEDDERTKEELEALAKLPSLQFFDDKNIHSLVEIQQFMRQHPDLAKHILAEFDSSELPANRREQIAGKLQSLAARELHKKHSKEEIKKEPEALPDEVKSLKDESDKKPKP